VQRVREAEVVVDGVAIAHIDRGLVILAGLGADDGLEDVEWMARKIASLRILDAVDSVALRSVVEADAAVLAVSQFTLMADCRKGRRPSYDAAMPSAEAARLFDAFVSALRAEIRMVETGRFGAAMEVRLVNDGPYTLIVDSPRASRARAPS
jgi:D-tyrosyl-tRNA(Tyr) deacylase